MFVLAIQSVTGSSHRVLELIRTASYNDLVGAVLLRQLRLVGGGCGANHTHAPAVVVRLVLRGRESGELNSQVRGDLYRGWEFIFPASEQAF